MNKKILALALWCAGTAAFAGPPKTPPNLAVDIDAPGAVRAQVDIRGPDLKEPLVYSIAAADGSILGGVYAPPGKGLVINVTAYGANKEILFKGSGSSNVDPKLTREFAFALAGREADHPLTARFGTNLLQLGFGAGDPGDYLLQATLLDPLGNHLPFKPEDIKWGAPKGFEILPYSCFRNSLCIELPDPKIYADFVACFRDITCWSSKPKDTRGPYVSVAVGYNHTCALTASADIRCWGDNQSGQLGAPTAWCQQPFGHNCSLVPVPVVCPVGEVCKFFALTAAANHTCAIDTAKKVWCWGEDGNSATGPRTPDFGLGLPTHRRVVMPAGTSLMSIDTNKVGTCGLSELREVWCWGSVRFIPFAGSIETPAKYPGTRQYGQVSVGLNHTCAKEFAGLVLDCFGDNFDYQVTGTLTLQPLQNLDVSPIVPLLAGRGAGIVSAGATTTCGQNWDANIICWGAQTSGSLSLTGGVEVQHRAYAKSLVTEAWTCRTQYGNFDCVRTCTVGIGGDFYCGDWWANPWKLTMVADPPSDHYVSWDQADVGINHVCGVTTQRDVWCFGSNLAGQFGTGVQTTTFVDTPTLPAIR